MTIKRSRRTSLRFVTRAGCRTPFYQVVAEQAEDQDAGQAERWIYLTFSKPELRRFIAKCQAMLERKP